MSSAGQKRITLFCGHYGSGKTNIAVNYALQLRKEHDKVAIADLDIVNPYFRTKDSAGVLQSSDIRLICSDYANTNVDVPALPADAYTVTEQKDLFAVVDVGGDDRGALALGRYAPAILQEQDYDMLLVINRFRPLTRTAADTLQVMREIEQAAGIAFTGIVNNSNLGEETTAQQVLDSISYARQVSQAAGIPLRFTCAKEDLLPQLTGKTEETIFPLKLYVKQKGF